MKIANNERIVRRIWNYRLPESYCTRTTNNVYCKEEFNKEHYAIIENRVCCESPECTVSFRSTICSILKIIKIEQKNNHNHLVKKEYNNLTRGIDDYYADLIDDCLKKKVTAVKRIQSHLTEYSRNLRIQFNSTNELAIGSEGDQIPLPSYDQIKYYVNNHRGSFREQLDVDVLEQYVNGKRFNPLIDMNCAFYYGINEKNDKLVLCTGA